jgi:hypothetical protein
VYAWLAEDPVFHQAYEDAREDAVDRLEDETWRRAVDGVLRPVYLDTGFLLLSGLIA